MRPHADGGMLNAMSRALLDEQATDVSQSVHSSSDGEYRQLHLLTVEQEGAIFAFVGVIGQERQQLFRKLERARILLKNLETRMGNDVRSLQAEQVIATHSNLPHAI